MIKSILRKLKTDIEDAIILYVLMVFALIAVCVIALIMQNASEALREISGLQ